jgi:hypothetical protein
MPKKTVLLILQLFDCSARLSDKRAIYISFRQSITSFGYTTQSKTLILLRKLQLSSITARLAIIGGKSHLGTLPKQAILAREGRSFTAIQVAARQLAVYATKLAFSVQSTAISELAAVPI